MRATIVILLTLSICVTMMVTGPARSAEKVTVQNSATPDASQLHHRYKHKLPSEAVPGSTAERRAAWDSLTPERKTILVDKIRPYLAEAARQGAKMADSGDDDEFWGLSLSDKHGHNTPQMWRRVMKGEPSLLQAYLNNATQPFTNTSRTLSQPTSDAKDRRQTRALPNHAIRREISGSPFGSNRSERPVPPQNPTFTLGPINCFDQFITASFQGALARQPSNGELSYWDNLMIQAQGQGQSQLVAQVQNLDYALFHTQEYLDRQRSDVDYVFDLYATYLHREPDQPGWDFWVSALSNGRDAVLLGFALSTEFMNLVNDLCAPGTIDADGDGLLDNFEGELADEFTPQYHISTNEPKHFARFYDGTPEVVSSTVSPYEPISHYRVTPLLKSGGLGYLRVDYMTLWDSDDGIQFDAACYANLYAVTDFVGTQVINTVTQVLQLNSSHNLDNERSVTLVAAPLVSGDYNANAAAYKAYEFFLSAHEGTPGDHSVILAPSSPVAPGGLSHIELALSRGKHATYAFNPYDPSYPDGVSQVPSVAVESAYGSITFLFLIGVICLQDYLALLYDLDYMFYTCMVDHFADSGGRYTQLRLNVGEVSHSLNGCGFIGYDSTKPSGGELYQQLTTPIPW